MTLFRNKKDGQVYLIEKVFPIRYTRAPYYIATNYIARGVTKEFDEKGLGDYLKIADL